MVNNAAAEPKHKIQVTGSIVVGRELTPLQIRAKETAEASLSDEELMRRGIQPGSQAARAMANGKSSAVGTIFRDDLQDSTGNLVRIANDGLTASYGIFGSPGAGKTHLVLHLLSGILGEVPARASPEWHEKKFGALILDPKATLIDDVSKMMAGIGRSSDLVILNTDHLIHTGKAVNVIDGALSPRELGRFLVMAAQSAGVEATEPYWFLLWGNLFGAALTLLENDATSVVTLHELIDAVLRPARGSRRIETIARAALENAKAMVTARTGIIDQGSPSFLECVEAIEQAADDVLAHFDSSTADSRRSVGVIDSFIRRAYGGFLEGRYRCYSKRSCAIARQYGVDDSATFYDAIIEHGKVVLVSISPSEPAFAKTLCTLVKSLFQQAVMGRKERCRRPSGAVGKLWNYSRPLLIACDEYSEVATELPGQPMGDGHFFALARENGCMGLLATQSVNVLENSSLKKSWRSVFSNFGAKFFMGAADNETVEEASKLAGEEDWEILSGGESISLDGQSYTTSHEFRERKSLPSRILTRTLRQGEAVIIGSLDGRETRPRIQMVRVPANIAGVR